MAIALLGRHRADAAFTNLLMRVVYNVCVYYAQFRSGDSQASCRTNEQVENKIAPHCPEQHVSNATPTIVKLEVRRAPLFVKL
jgi:hypothetical protein